MTYKAVVTRVTVKPHPNADRLQLAYCHGYQVIVGINVKEGDLGVFFGPDGQLSEQFAEANDLIARTDPATGNKTGGYFSEKRRVRSQTLRGSKSYGFWTPLDSLLFTGYDISKLREGDSFDQLNGVPICNKYFTPKTLATKGQVKADKADKSNIMFPKHVETEQLRHISSIEDGTIVTLSEKLHGTSARYGYIKDKQPLPQRWWQKLLKRPVSYEDSWVHESGTRNIILGKTDKPGFYGSEQFRIDVFNTFKDKLYKGEVVYGEIVGYTHTGQSIMAPHSLSKVKSKELPYYLQKDRPMYYNYGCIEGLCAFYVYRILMINEDGIASEYSDYQMRSRCIELGLHAVPKLLSTFTYEDDKHKALLLPEYIEEMFLAESSCLDSWHIKEGVVFRLDKPDGTVEFIKHKSYLFGVLEGYIKDEDDYVDMEEVA